MTNLLCYAQIEEIVIESTEASPPPQDKGVYKNGLKEGYWIVYKNNNIEKGNYLKGEKNGEWKIYDKYNKIKSLENYIKGKKNGKLIEYYDNGIVSKEGSYLDDKYHGELTFYDEEGTLVQKIELSKGLKNGKYITYYPSGKIRSVDEYLNGKLHGNSITNHKNGKISSKGKYLNGKNGLWLYYSRKGNLIRSGNYLDSKEIGVWNSYYDQIDGPLYRKREYDDGKITIGTEYRKDNTLERIVKFFYNQNDPPYYFEEYDVNSNIFYSGFKNIEMKKVGVWKKYNSNGDIIEEEKYHNGEKIE